ncbi:BMC domain-containing protein [Sphaerothrix gracilis]|uniref:BMC domain-containing protein n=1 Tax=Sphaerothrix gracilis TaxID=3151835 RepID=UPI0031FC98BA
MTTLGIIEVFGLSTAIQVADSMCKSGQVELVQWANAEAGLISVAVQGPVADVQAAIAAGLTTAQQCGAIASHRLITGMQAQYWPGASESTLADIHRQNQRDDMPETYLD